MTYDAVLGIVFSASYVDTLLKDFKLVINKYTPPTSTLAADLQSHGFAKRFPKSGNSSNQHADISVQLQRYPGASRADRAARLEV